MNVFCFLRPLAFEALWGEAATLSPLPDGVASYPIPPVLDAYAWSLTCLATSEPFEDEEADRSVAKKDGRPLPF